MKQAILLFVSFCFISLGVLAGDRRIVLDGIPLDSSTHTIVIPAEPTQTELLAARELHAFLAQITGQEIPVETEGKSSSPYGLFLGRCSQSSAQWDALDDGDLGMEGIAISCRKGNLRLGGGQRGVLYAVYTFLEDYLDCHWFTDDCSVIPDHGEIGLPAFSFTYHPPLEFRDLDFRETRSFEFGVRNKLNGHYLQNIIPEEQGGCHSYYPLICHTFQLLVPTELYAAEHPEFYAERDGRRFTDEEGKGAHTQLCLTNPDVLEIAKETVRKWMRESPPGAIISVSQNDNQDYCTCADCRALAEKEGSEAGPLLHFINAIARDIADEFPGRLLDTLAYQYTRNPPKYVRPEPNVVVRLCSIECCFLHPMEDCQTERETLKESFQNDLREWARVTNRLYVWDYVINFVHSIAPFPNLQVLKPNINFLVANHVRGIYEEGNYYSGLGDMEELRSYVMAKLLWNPQVDVMRAIRDFTNAYYGPAAPAIRNYLALLQDSMAADGDSVHMYIFDHPNKYLRHPETLNQANDILAAAEALVAEQSVFLRRVQVARIPILYARYLMNIAPEDNREAFEYIVRVGRENKLDRVSEVLEFERWIVQQQRSIEGGAAHAED